MSHHLTFEWKDRGTNKGFYCVTNSSCDRYVHLQLLATVSTDHAEILPWRAALTTSADATWLDTEAEAMKYIEAQCLMYYEELYNELKNRVVKEPFPTFE